MQPTPSTAKKREREELERKVAEYLANGGTIKEVPETVSKTGIHDWREFVLNTSVGRRGGA